jgi:hypothetical protein
MPDIVGNGDDLGDHIATRSLKQIKGSDVASADSILLQADGNTFDVTGTTTINHIASTNWVVGSIAILHFDASLQITNNAGGLSGAECNILLSGDADFTTQSGDILTLLLHDSTSWQEISRNSSGSVSNGSITNAKLANMAGNTVKVRDANSTGVPSDKAVGDTQILIGDGTGFTVASLSGQATMTNAGVVTIGTLNQNTTGTSATVTGATQANITTCANLTTTGALNAGSITSGFGTINNGSSTITTTGAVATGALTVTGIITGSTNVVLNAQGALRLNDSDNSNYAGFKAPANVTASYDLIMPPATGATGQVLKMSSTSNTLEWGSAGGGATIVHTYTNTTNTSYLGTASSFSTVGVGDRDIFIKKIDANNEGVFTKIWKNGSAVEVQIA